MGLILLKATLPLDVAERYREDFPDNALSPEIAFRELLKYLWVCEKLAEEKRQHPENRDLDFDIYIQSEMQEIDDLWHTFLLFTREYQQFCQENFGRFVHHVPVTMDEKKNKDKEEFLLETQKALEYVYDNLGEETLKIWYKEYFTDEA